MFPKDHLAATLKVVRKALCRRSSLRNRERNPGRYDDEGLPSAADRAQQDDTRSGNL